jgi:formate-dependent nitrite reductase membrane component NrfD
MVPDAEPRTYYDVPILKEPVWTWEIPAYLFTGGIAAGAALLAAGADLTSNRALARAMQWASMGATAVSGGLLVADLGVPSRFHHMLRVVKPTSPMNVGSWLLAGFGGSTGVATASMVFGRFPRIGRASRIAAAALAPGVATYTGVLVADTAVPAWHEARRTLPALFAAGAAASAGALGVVLVDPAAAAPARRLAVVGAVAELVSATAMERQLGPVVGRPYREGPASALHQSAEICTCVGAAVVLFARRRRTLVAGGVLEFMGAALERFAVLRAGRESAGDPAATVSPQRAASDAASRLRAEPVGSRT